MLSHVEPYFWDYIQQNHETLYLSIDEPNGSGETIQEIIDFYRDSVAFGKTKLQQEKDKLE